MKVSVFEGTSA